MRIRALAPAAAGSLTLTTAALAATPASAADGAQPSVLHAVKGQTVDVYVNGERTLNNFKPGSLAGPPNLAGGSYEVAITADDAEDDSDPLIGPIDHELEDGRKLHRRHPLGGGW